MSSENRSGDLHPENGVVTDGDARHASPPHDEARGKDDLGIRIGAVVVVALLSFFALTFQDQATGVIQNLRTFVTRYFTWYFVLFATSVLIFVLAVGLGRHGDIRLGGKEARPDYSRFAWYSMLFACGQGIGLIFWSVAEPILLENDDPLEALQPTTGGDGPLAWTYFHWGLTAWAIYCVVALCIAYSVHNRKQAATFRGACEDLFGIKSRRPAGIVIEFLAIIATVLGISTSFGFASLQFTAGLGSLFGLDGTLGVKVAVIMVMGAVAAASVYFGINRGMKIVSELNSILSVLLVVGVALFGPTLYLLHLLPQSFGAFISRFVAMSAYTDPSVAASGISTWSDSWNGNWTVFIWCWCIAFSPFVASFIATISRGRTLREFVIGVIGIPTVIVMVWVGILGGMALHYDEESRGRITAAVGEDVSSGLFASLKLVPSAGWLLTCVATVLVSTYFVTSLDSGVHALSTFVSMSARPSGLFRVVLVTMIVVMSLLLLVLGGGRTLDTIQTGTIIGALPFSFIILMMMGNFVRRIRNDTREDGGPGR